jgi:hypothetical protein
MLSKAGRCQPGNRYWWTGAAAPRITTREGGRSLAVAELGVLRLVVDFLARRVAGMDVWGRTREVLVGRIVSGDHRRADERAAGHQYRVLLGLVAVADGGLRAATMIATTRAQEWVLGCNDVLSPKATPISLSGGVRQ